MMQGRGRGVARLTVWTAWALLSLVTAAWADGMPPLVTSAVREGAVEIAAGQALRLRIVASDATGLGGVSAGFRSPFGHELTARPVPGSPGLAELAVHSGLPNGAYSLVWLAVWDTGQPEARASYLPDGRVVSDAPGAPQTHGLDLGALGFTVTGNPQADVDPPVLTAAARSLPLARAGETQRLTLGATDATGLAGTAVGFRGPNGWRLEAQGELDLALGPELPDGTYELDWITLWDAADPSNAASYLRDGRVTSTVTTAPATHALDLPALDFVMQGNELRADVALALVGSQVPLEVTPRLPVSPAGEGVVIETSRGSLTAGGVTGARVPAEPAGAGRFVARLSADAPGLATITAWIDGRELPPLVLRILAEPLATQTALAAPGLGRPRQPLTLVATVTAPGAVPGGQVDFRRDGVLIGAAALDPLGTARLETVLPPGVHHLTAQYAGGGVLAPSASAVRVVTVAPERPLEFLGGGAVFGMTAPCQQAGWQPGPHPFALRYGPGEENGMPSQIGLLWPEGAEHLQVWQPLTPSPLNFDALGRQVWSFFVLHGLNPRVTPVQRRITQPPGASLIHDATEVMLRLRVSNFAGIPGCGATVAGVVRRGD